MMLLSEIARFLSDHPDFAPAILKIEGEYTFHGFNGPEGGYFSFEEIERLMRSKPRPQRRSWKNWRARK